MLYEHPAVRRGGGDRRPARLARRGGRRRRGAASPAPAPPPEELRDWVKERVAAYKYPRQCGWSTQLPKGPTGKILKREITVPRGQRGRRSQCGSAGASVSTPEAGPPAAGCDAGEPGVPSPMRPRAPRRLTCCSPTRRSAPRAGSSPARSAAPVRLGAGPPAGLRGRAARAAWRAELARVAGGGSALAPAADGPPVRRPRVVGQPGAAPGHAGLPGDGRPPPGAGRRRASWTGVTRSGCGSLVRQPGRRARAEQQPAATPRRGRRRSTPAALSAVRGIQEPGQRSRQPAPDPVHGAAGRLHGRHRPGRSPRARWCCAPRSTS